MVICVYMSNSRYYVYHKITTQSCCGEAVIFVFIEYVRVIEMVFTVIYICLDLNHRMGV